LAVHLQPGPELEKVERKAAEWERFKTLTCQIEQASESICDARPPLSEHPCITSICRLAPLPALPSAYA
jgi:hypothetical protein